MNRWARCVLLGILFVVAMVLPSQLVSLAQEPAKEPVRPAPEVIAAWEIVGFYGAADNGGTFVRTVKQAPVKVGDRILVTGTGLYDGNWNVLQRFQYQDPMDPQPLWGYRIEPKWQGFPPGFTNGSGVPARNAAKLQLVSLAQEPAKEPVRPAPEVIAAWEKAGAVFGWSSVDQWGNLEWRDGKEKSVAGALPAFRVTVFPIGKLKALPPPDVPFGLHLAGPQVSDARLKELAGLTQLQSLNLLETQVNDAGLKELAGMKQLKTLDLSYTQVTDAGLNELAGLTQLRSLNLANTQVTDAGVQELQKTLPQVRIIR
jgi:hypothetical protein